MRADSLKKLLHKFFKFLLVGGLATAIHYLLLIILVETVDMRAATASAIGFSISAVGNYVLNHRYTFVSSASHKAAFPKFMLTAATGLGINTVTIAMFTEYLSVHYLLAQLVATAVTLIWNFSINAAWSFRA